MFDETIVASVGLRFNQSPGDVLDEHAAQRWHRDVCWLTGRKLVAFAEAIAANTHPQRSSLAQVRDLIRLSIQSGYSNLNALQPNVVAKLGSKWGARVPPMASPLDGCEGRELG